MRTSLSLQGGLCPVKRVIQKYRKRVPVSATLFDSGGGRHDAREFAADIGDNNAAQLSAEWARPSKTSSAAAAGVARVLEL